MRPTSTHGAGSGATAMRLRLPHGAATTAASPSGSPQGTLPTATSNTAHPVSMPTPISWRRACWPECTRGSATHCSQRPKRHLMTQTAPMGCLRIGPPRLHARQAPLSSDKPWERRWHMCFWRCGNRNTTGSSPRSRQKNSTISATRSDAQTPVSHRRLLSAMGDGPGQAKQHDPTQDSIGHRRRCA